MDHCFSDTEEFVLCKVNKRYVINKFPHFCNIIMTKHILSNKFVIFELKEKKFIAGLIVLSPVCSQDKTSIIMIY